MRRRALELAKEHGWNATSFQTLSPGFNYFFYADGYVAYVDTGSAWVAAGAPVCTTSALLKTTVAFGAAARSAGKRWLFFGAEPRLLEETDGLLRSILIGQEPVWDPSEWKDTLARHSSLREQIRRAKAKGVEIHGPAEGDRVKLDAEIPRLAERWLMTRSMPAMGFLVTVHSKFTGGEGLPFAAWQRGVLVATAWVMPVPRRDGVFIEHLLRDPIAPNGTIELLLDAIFAWASATEKSFLTLGLAPLAGPVPRPLRFARKRLRFLYDFEGLERFKSKLRPRDRLPIFLAFPHSQNALQTTFDALRAFATDGLLRYALRFITLGHPLVLGFLAVLLVPWTSLVAASPAELWFAGHEMAKWAWVAFDAAIVLGLVRLLVRPSVILSRALSIAVTLDAVVTPLEALIWNWPNLTRPLEAAIVLVACMAPIIASVTLWSATARLRRLRSP